MHAFQDLVMLMSKCKSCWPLKRHLRAYINRLYYRSSDYENISQHFVEIDIYVEEYRFNTLIEHLIRSLGDNRHQD